MDDKGTETNATPDQAAAHEFLSELRTRITTQPLPYQYGVEARALESLWEVFAHAREAMKNHPGCNGFADAVTRMLNVDVRPVTAKWHRAYAEGRLNSRDGADAFRADLAQVQIKLRRFAAELHQMAYGELGGDPLTPPAMPRSEVQALLASVPFGIVGNQLIDTETAAKINAAEREAVTQRRKHWQIPTIEGSDAVGLSLSGGGIRSATFCLGIVQVLAERGLLKDVDFLSTVSGGGYTGSFLSARLGSGQTHRDVAQPYGPDTEAIRYLRQHAKYLAAIDLKQRWSMLTATLAGLLLNWSAPLLVILIASLAAIGYRHQFPTMFPWRLLVSISGSLSVVALLVYSGLLTVSRGAALRSGSVLAGFTAITVLLATAWAVDEGYNLFRAAIRWWPSSALLATLVAAGPAVLRIMPVAQRPSVRKLLLTGVLLLAGWIIPLGAIGLFYFLWYMGDQSLTATQILIGCAIVIGLIAIFLLNINLTGLHRLYRDQLARTFVQPSEPDNTSVPLAAMNPGGAAPYHLINTTVNLPSSTHPALRERRSDFFLFSKAWCGSPSTGYYPTSAWKTNGAGLDLATAMAISGAAASSHMGLGSKPTLRALLTFLNVRLGFWLLRAGEETWLNVPGFLCLLREMTGIGMSEQRKWINLSDGGHIENMGAYELLRRRCKFIICVDGEADPDCTFHGLMTLARHVQIDFGVGMEPALLDLRPNAATGFSQAHASLFRVHYADRALGLFLYLKLSVTGNEPELIRRYRLLHPEFPHQTTLDQFFDEEQFEVYRQLGVHVAEGLFASALLGAKATPGSVPEWFSRLAANLLHPASS